MAGSKNTQLVADAARDPKVRAAVASAAVAAGGAVAAGKLVRDRIVERSRARRRSYRLQPDESASEGVRRIACGQIDLAIEQLEKASGGELDEAVHESRKAFKRMRALVRLARDGLGDETYRRENKTFRDAGRALSGVRDARVMVHTLDELMDRYGDDIPDGSFRRLHETLSAEARTAHKQLENDPTAVGDVLTTLRTARVRVETWPLPESDEFLAPGFKRIYKRGRKATRVVKAKVSTEALHELRKRAKDLRHAAEVLRPADAKPTKKLARQAHRLSNAAGDDHDLAVLYDGAQSRADTLEPGEVELLDALVARRRRALQRDVLARARRVYRRKPRKLARRLQGIVG